MSESEKQPAPSIQATIEALLFVSAEPVPASQLAAALEVPVAVIETGLSQLDAAFKERGLRLQRHAGRYQLTTAPEMAPMIERFLGLELSSRLSHAALEALSIVAFQQPVTRPMIDSIRGVNSDGVMKSLLSKGLIQEVGRTEGPGRPILYGTTPDFLQHFGLNSLSELPALNLEPGDAGNRADMILKG